MPTYITEAQTHYKREQNPTIAPQVLLSFIDRVQRC
jgi:hypothetical protein